MILGTSIGKINIKGVILAFSASLVYSVYIISSNKIIKKTPPIITSAYITLFAALGTFVYSLLFESFNFNFELIAWLPIIGIIVFPTIFAMIFFFKGMDLLGPTKTSIISLLEAVFVVAFSVVLLKDHLTIFQLIGGLAVLTSAYLAVKTKIA